MKSTKSSPDSLQMPTVGQLERELSQKFQAFYREHLGQRPSKVSTQIFGTKVAIVLEDTITKPEQLLMHDGKAQLAQKVREDLHQVLRPKMEVLLESILSVKVLDILSDSAFDSGRFGVIVILSEEPNVRQK